MAADVREKEQLEYLFLDLEWNQAPGTTGLDGRELLDFTERVGADIADPWYTGNFDRTYEDVKEGCEALLEDCLLRL